MTNNDLEVKKEGGRYKIETGPLDYDAAMKRRAEMMQAAETEKQNRELKKLLIYAAAAIIFFSALIVGYSLTQAF